MDFSNQLKIKIVKLISTFADYGASFTIGTVIDTLYQAGCWPQNLNRVNAYFRVQQIVDDIVPHLGYDCFIEDLVTVYVPKKKMKELEQEEKYVNMTEEEMIDEIVKNIPIDNNYEFKLPKFNQFWNKGWEKFF